MLGLLLFIPCFELGSGLYGDYPPTNEAGLQMLHDVYLNTGNTTGFWGALQAYQDSSSYRLVSCAYNVLTWHVEGLKQYQRVQGPVATLPAVQFLLPGKLCIRCWYMTGIKTQSGLGDVSLPAAHAAELLWQMRRI